MLMLLAKEVVENQSLMNLDWSKIVTDSIATIISVCAGAILAYWFTRKSDRKNLRDDREVNCMLNLQSELTSCFNQYCIDKPNTCKILYNIKRDECDVVDLKKQLYDILPEQRILLLKIVNLSIGFRALENIKSAKEVYDKFIDFYSYIIGDIKELENITNKARVIIGEYSSKDTFRLNTFEMPDDIVYINDRTYRDLQIEIQKFIFKK